jgi:predicted Zn-dependent protease with MMP-like domain
VKGGDLTRKARRIVSRFLDRLPPELAPAANEVLIAFKRRPPAGMDADLLGLFEGPTRDEFLEGHFEMPPRVTLYVENIWDEGGRKARGFDKEVRVTLYHELGHYIGFSEKGLEARGLG